MQHFREISVLSACNPLIFSLLKCHQRTFVTEELNLMPLVLGDIKMPFLAWENASCENSDDENSFSNMFCQLIIQVKIPEQTDGFVMVPKFRGAEPIFYRV